LSKEDILRILQRELPYLRQQYGVVRISLYGSYASGTATDQSDVDLVIELSRPLGLEFVSLAEHLEAVLGREVDLITQETLQRSLDQPRYHRIASRVRETLTDVYAEAR
jgi:predicted nucleotidyltransferase